MGNKEATQEEQLLHKRAAKEEEEKEVWKSGFMDTKKEESVKERWEEYGGRNVC